MESKNGFFRRLALLLVAILAIYLVTIATFQIAFGTQTPFMVVISNSMYPTLKINDIIVVKNVPIDDIKVGDIIVFKSPLNPDIPIVHRVVDIGVRNGVKFFITKGDNNPTRDPWTVTPEMVIGKVIYVIPQIGFIPKILNSNPSLKFALAILIISLIIVNEYIDYKKKQERAGYIEGGEDTEDEDVGDIELDV